MVGGVGYAMAESVCRNAALSASLGGRLAASSDLKLFGKCFFTKSTEHSTMQQKYHNKETSI